LLFYLKIISPRPSAQFIEGGKNVLVKMLHLNISKMVVKIRGNGEQQSINTDSENCSFE
jgi:hypothetical protein